MRIVLDTNVVVSALIWGGTPYKLIEAAAAGEIELVTSPALLAELRGVLGRDPLRTRLLEKRSSLEQAMGYYSELAISSSPLQTPRVVPNDADDDHVIAAALAATADLIVSGDRDLLSMGSHEGIGIVNAAEAAERIGVSS